MAKRYHQSFKDRMDEHRGAERMEHKEYYAGMDARRHQEMQDAGMIHEDHSAIANLPQQVKITAYPKVRDYVPEVLDDTIRGIDRQMDYDNGQRARNFKPKKV